MVELVIAPNRFQRLLNVGLIGKALKDVTSVTASFRPDGLYIDDKKSPFVGVKAFFPTHYFISYKVPESEEKVTLTSTMLEPFGFNKAFEQEKLKITTKDNKIFYTSEGEKKEEVWNDNLEEVKESKFSFAIPDSDKGFIPGGQSEVVQALLEVSQMRIHTCEYYRFLCDGQKLRLEVTEPGIYHRTLNLLKTTKLGELSYQVPGALFEAIIGLFAGEVWLTLFEKAVVMSQKTKESSLTYIFVPRSE